MEYKLLLLGLLRNAEMYGYQLYDFLENNLGVCIQLKKPTAYKILNQMNHDGWITYRIEQEGNRPPRRVYSVTAEGEAAFFGLLQENLAQYHATEFPSDVGLLFLDALSPEGAVPLLKQRRAAVDRLLQEVESVPPHRGGAQLLIEHQRRYYTSELAWLDGLLSQVRSEQKKPPK